MIAIIKGVIWRVVLAQTVTVVIGALLGLVKEVAFLVPPTLAVGNVLSMIMVVNSQPNKWLCFFIFPLELLLASRFWLLGSPWGFICH